MDNVQPTKRDIDHATRVFHDNTYYDGDDWEPETLMFSWGYGELWADGDVVAFGRVVFNVDD